MLYISNGWATTYGQSIAEAKIYTWSGGLVENFMHVRCGKIGMVSHFVRKI